MFWLAFGCVTYAKLIDYRERGGFRMMNPSHAGDSILFGCLGVEGEDEDVIEVTDAATMLGVPCETLQQVLDGHAPVTPDLARRLEAVGWSTAEFWLRRQASYDAAQERLQRRSAPA